MLKAAREVVVGVTRPLSFIGLLLASSVQAKILPEDRNDILWHSYDGGGVKIEGPSVLVRKSYKDKVSVWGNYYVDMISGASIDVESTASKYSEERQEISAGFDYLHDRTQIGFGVTQSIEDDYQANTARFSISQDFFGDLSTLTVGYSYGDDIVKRNGDIDFEEKAKHQSYRLELSQILTRRLIVNSWF